MSEADAQYWGLEVRRVRTVLAIHPAAQPQLFERLRDVPDKLLGAVLINMAARGLERELTALPTASPSTVAAPGELSGGAAPALNTVAPTLAAPVLLGQVAPTPQGSAKKTTLRFKSALVAEPAVAAALDA